MWRCNPSVSSGAAPQWRDASLPLQLVLLLTSGAKAFWFSLPLSFLRCYYPLISSSIISSGYTSNIWSDICIQRLSMDSTSPGRSTNSVYELPVAFSIESFYMEWQISIYLITITRPFVTHTSRCRKISTKLLPHF